MGAVASVGKGLLQISGASSEAQAIKRQAEFEQQQLGFNRKLSEINAKDSLARGEQQVKQVKRQSTLLKGQQKAALAAQGIDVTGGSIAAIEYETEKQINTDIARIRNNAWRESWGYQIEATNIGTQSRLTGIAARGRASTTILAGGLQAFESFAQAGASLAEGGGGQGGGSATG